MKLYGVWISPFVNRTAMYLTEKGIDFELVEPPDGLKSDAYKKINPILKIPALEHDGNYIVESEVICEYLEDLFPDPPLRPKDAVGRAQARTVSRVLDLYYIGEIGPLMRQRDPETRDQAVVDATLKVMSAGLDWLEAFIGDKGFAVGDHMTIADCAMVPVFHLVLPMIGRFGVSDPLEGHPRLAAYWQAIQKQPSAEFVMGEMTEARQQFRAQSQ